VGFKTYLQDQLVSFGALTLLVWSYDLWKVNLQQKIISTALAKLSMWCQLSQMNQTNSSHQKSTELQLFHDTFVNSKQKQQPMFILTVFGQCHPWLLWSDSIGNKFISLRFTSHSPFIFHQCYSELLILCALQMFVLLVLLFLKSRM